MRMGEMNVGEQQKQPRREKNSKYKMITFNVATRSVLIMCLVFFILYDGVSQDQRNA